MTTGDIEAGIETGIGIEIETETETEEEEDVESMTPV